jgi:HlyD family secretion protein
VVVDVPNDDGALLPGMTANARFLVAEYQDVLTIPNTALSWKPKDYQPPRGADQRAAERGEPGTGATIFVVGEDGKPEPRRVRLGASDNDRSIVLAGPLAVGDQVIVGEQAPASGRGGGGRSR